jgi:hypothetical protein
MKKITLLVLFVMAATWGMAQGNQASPAAEAHGMLGQAHATVKYAQPAVKGRNVWAGNLAPYSKVWRTGADNATTLELDKDVKIEGKALAAGKYSLFTIPGEKEWTIIINKNAAQWGAYSYKEAEDVLRVSVPAGKAKNFVERFTIAIDNSTMNLSWENVSVNVSFK